MTNDPFGKTQSGASALTAYPANPLRRILLVDDDSGIRYLNTDVLEHSGYKVDAAEDGEAGWEALLAHSYDLLITDNNMPKISGVELVKKVRAARMALPVILSSGAMPEEELSRHPWLQLSATLRKPFTTEELLRTVRTALRAPEGDCAPLDPPPGCPSQPHSVGLRERASWL